MVSHAQAAFPLDFLFMPPGSWALFRGRLVNANKHSSEMTKKKKGKDPNFSAFDQARKRAM